MVPLSELAVRLIPGKTAIQVQEDQSLMSIGDEIRPHHYVTFLDVLGKMTGTEGEWDLGPSPKAR